MTVAMIVLRMMILMAIMMIMTVSMIAMIVLRMILTLEGFLHLSSSRLTGGRLPCSQVSPGCCPHLQRRANPFEKQELDNMLIQTPTTSPSEETKVAQT